MTRLRWAWENSEDPDSARGAGLSGSTLTVLAFLYHDETLFEFSKVTSMFSLSKKFEKFRFFMLSPQCAKQF